MQRRRQSPVAALLHLPLGPLRRLRSRAWRGARSCNLAVWRSDLDRVDGFDADYSGWGKEDSDIIVRLLHAGVAPQGRRVRDRRPASVARRGRPRAAGGKRAQAVRQPCRRPRARAARAVGAARRAADGGGLTDGAHLHHAPIDHARFRAARRLAGGRARRRRCPGRPRRPRILLVLWLLALVPTLDWADVRREAADAGRRPAGAAGRARRCRHGLGRRQLGRALGRGRILRQAAGDPAAVRAISPLRARLLRVRRLISSPASCCCCDRPSFIRRALVASSRRRSGQERRDAERRIRHSAFSACCISRSNALERRRWRRVAGFAVRGARHAGQYVFRRHRPHGAGHHPGAAGPVRGDEAERQGQGGLVRRRDRASPPSAWFSSPYLRDRTHRACGPAIRNTERRRAHLVRRAHRILEEVARLYPRGADHRPRHRHDRRVVRRAVARQNRPGASGSPTSAQSDLRRRHPARARRRRRAVGDVDRASAVVSRRAACRMDRARRRRAEYRRLAVQFASVRFRPGLDLCDRRRRRRRHGAEAARRAANRPP